MPEKSIRARAPMEYKALAYSGGVEPIKLAEGTVNVQVGGGNLVVVWSASFTIYSFTDISA